MRVLAVLALAALPGVAAADGPFTLEGVLSAPYPSELVAAAGADRIAWVTEERGVRNLWTAAAPDFEPMRLTSYSDDDGQALGQLALTADGVLLVYVRGGGPNAAGETPNPAGDPAGAEQAIWAVPTAGGEPWKVAAGGGPVVSPDGGRVVYARGSQVFETSLERPSGETASGEAVSGKDEKPPPLFQARGNLGGVTFSPDGARLAFVSARGDHGFVGVFDRAAKKITWMAPSVDRDDSPVFSPDGTRLAFLRLPGRLMDERYDITTGTPFAVWVGDPATGEAREVWRSPGADGGFAQFYYDPPLRWAGPEHLAFTSEHEGWVHVYQVTATGGAAAGGAAIDLTPGESEVESFAVSPDGAALYFSGNRDDVDRRHLWRVTPGADPQPLTSGEGLETDPTPLAGGRWVAYRGADFRRPPAVTVVAPASGERRLVAPRELPASFPAADLVVPLAVTFQASDGVTVHGQLFLPPGSAAGDARPGVLFMHGGPVRQMLLGWHHSGYYARCYAFNQYLASRGTVVLSVNFRSGIGYGRAFRQAADQGPRGASEYRDVLAAGRYLQERPEVDPRLVGLWGGSYGGYLTALGLARDSDLFAAGVDLHGVHDWSYRGERFPTSGGAWGLQGEELLALAKRSSPVADLGFWSSPVLFVHGDDDRNVMFIQTTDLVQRLRQRDVHVETLVFPDEVHGFLRHESWLRTFRAAADFFERFLGHGTTTR